ncbi:MAG: hypothetical protein US81_C0012G0010 [Parcubacteria group bacterium GW2011_GWE2_38_18]|nr:MAG: hypothetical protein US81_C0012G0010 [Parcubacteria group bacterium GW2011_GWE2_38_18]
MNAKDLIIDFINFAFAVVLIIFCILYFIIPGRMETASDLMNALVPISFFAIAFLIKIKISRYEYKVNKKNNTMDIVLNLSYLDKTILEVLIFAMPIVSLIIALAMDGKLTFSNIFQSLFSFLIFYFFYKYLFGKRVY